MVTEVEISATGKNIELNHTVLSQAFLWRSLMALKVACSATSRPKSCTIFIPLMRSWTKVLRLAISFRTSSKAFFIDFWNTLVA